MGNYFSRKMALLRSGKLRGLDMVLWSNGLIKSKFRTDQKGWVGLICNFLFLVFVCSGFQIQDTTVCFVLANNILFGVFLLVKFWHQVVRAIKKDTRKVYALKIMDKKFITKENKTAYVKLERIVLDQLTHPGIVQLHFTFQDTYSLCKHIMFTVYGFF